MCFQRTWSIAEAGAKEGCASCSKPIYSAERMVIQNVPLHRSCFYCKSCGRKLSLLNYTTFRDAFYCKVHYSLLAGAKGQIREEHTTVKQNYQQLPTASLPSSESETKIRNTKTGKFLMREKMQPRLSSFQPQTGLRSPKATTQLDSQNKFRIRWPLLKEAADGDAGETFNKASKKLLQETVSILHNQSRADGITQKALEDKSIAETIHMEKKQSQLPRVTFPKRGEHVSHWVKTVGGGGDGGILRKRVSFIDRSIPEVQPRKQGPSVAERTTMFEHDMLKLTRLPTVSPLTSILTKPSSVGSFPSHSEALRIAKVTNFAATRGAAPGACDLAKASLESNKLSKSSSCKDVSDERSERPNFQSAEPLPSLPLLTSPDDRQKRKLLEDSKSNILITPTLEGAEQFRHVNTEEAKCEMEEQESSQSKPEAPGCPTEHKEERNKTVTDHHAGKKASYPDAVETSLTTDQTSGHSWVGRNTFPGQHKQTTYPESLQSFGIHLCAKIHTKLTEIEEEEETQPGRKLEIFETLLSATDQAFQDTEPEGKPISLAAEIEDGQPESSLQAAYLENMNVPPRNSLQDTTPTCNVTPSANENPEPIRLSIRNSTTNGELPKMTSCENNIQRTSQENTFGRTVLQGAIPQVKQPEPFSSCGGPYFINSNATEIEDAKLLSKDGVQAAQGKNATDDSDRKPLLKRESDPFASFFASKIQGAAPKQEPARVKKAPKTPSALVTLFGCSLDEGKNPKEWPRKTNSSVETSNEQLQFASYLKPGASKKEGTSVAVTQTGDSKASAQDAENVGSQSQEGEEQGGSSPSSQHARGFSADMLSTDSGAGISQNEEP